MRVHLKKIFILFSILIFSAIFLFLNIGNYLDISQKPSKSDLIVCLGGGDNLIRIKKAFYLYEEGYSEKNILLITGGTDFTKVDNTADARIAYLNSKKSTVGIVYNTIPINTAQEIAYIKRYMLEHNFKSVIIVSEPLYSRRINMLSNIFDLKASGIKSCIVSSEPSWWDSQLFYENKTARYMAFVEMLKIPYNYLKYAVLDKLGLLPQIEALEDRLKFRELLYKHVRENIE